jgi:hypothetical protein
VGEMGSAQRRQPPLHRVQPPDRLPMRDVKTGEAGKQDELKHLRPNSG